MHISQGKFEFDREEVVQFEYTFVGKKKKEKHLVIVLSIWHSIQTWNSCLHKGLH